MFIHTCIMILFLACSLSPLLIDHEDFILIFGCHAHHACLMH